KAARTNTTGSRHASLRSQDCVPSKSRRDAVGDLLVDRVPNDGAGHAMPAAAAAPELGARDRYDFDAFLAQQRIGVHVAVVGKAHTRRHADEIGAAIPLRALAHVGVAAGLDDAHLFDP